MKQILSDQNNAYIPVMATSRKQFTHLLWIDVVNKSSRITRHGSPFAVPKSSGTPSLNLSFAGRWSQSCRRYSGGSLCKMTTASSTHDTRERMPKFQIIIHGWSVGENAPLPRHSPYLYPKGTDEFSAKFRRLKKEILYIFSWVSMTLATVSPPFLLRLIFFSICTVTVCSPVQRILALITSNFTNCLAL